MLMTKSELRKLVRVMFEAGKKKKKLKTVKDNEKELMLDKPFTTGGWPEGEDRGWLPGSKPVNVQVRDYLKSLGLL